MNEASGKEPSYRAQVWQAVERDETLTPLEVTALGWLLAMGCAEAPTHIERMELARRLEAMSHGHRANHVPNFLARMERKGYVKRHKGHRISVHDPRAPYAGPYGAREMGGAP